MKKSRIEHYRPSKLRYDKIRAGRGHSQATPLVKSRQSRVPAIGQRYDPHDDTRQHHETIQDPSSHIQLLLAHPLLGSRKQWSPFVRALHHSLTSNHISADIYIPDLRHHGDTAADYDYIINDNDDKRCGSDNNNINDYQYDYLTHCAFDIETFIHTTMIPDSIHMHSNDIKIGLMGHSLGGRAIMVRDILLSQHKYIDNNPKHSNILNEYTLSHFDDKSSQYIFPTVSFDATPASYTHTHDIVIDAMKAVEDCPATFSKNKIMDVMKKFQNGVLDANTIAFITMNNFPDTLSPDLTDEDKFKWKVNLDIIKQIQSEVMKWPIVLSSEKDHVLTQHSPPETFKSIVYKASETPFLFIGGDQSDRISNPVYHNTISSFFPNSSIEMVRGGHFAHQGIDMAKVADMSVKHVLDTFKMNNYIHI